MSLESTSYWQAKVGLRETTLSSIIVSEISFIAGTTKDAESIARPLSLSIASLSCQEYTVDYTATHNSAYTVGGVNYELTDKDLAISFSSGAPS